MQKLPDADRAAPGKGPLMPKVATHRRIAEVLEELSQEVEMLGTMLSRDLEVAMRHMDALQAIDLIAQKQRSLATLIEAEHPEAEIERIPIDTLRNRMRLPH